MTDSLQPEKPAAPRGEEWRQFDGQAGVYDPGRSAAALQAARAGIEQHRKGALELQLLGRDGRPLAGQPVALEQTGHAFLFGEQLWALDAMYRDGEEHTGRARAWRRRFREVFNAATNLCYWTERPLHDASKTEELQGEPRVENFARTVDWCLANGLTAKGHPLFWSIEKGIPDWVKRYDYATQMKFAEVRVRNLVARFRGRVKVWDATNEALWEPALKNLSRREWPHLEPVADMVAYVAEVLRWCREEDPEACFVVNDYGTENQGPGQPPASPVDGTPVTAARQRRRFIELAGALGEAGHAPDALGLQSHTGWVNDHREQTEVYDAYAATGLPVHVTEFWAHAGHLEKLGVPAAEIDALQAEYVANYLTCAFGHPAVEAFFFWGFMGMAIDWKERSGHALRPVFERVRKLIHDDWNTRWEGRADADGRVSLRGFYGDYRLRTVPPGAAHTRGQVFRHERGQPAGRVIRLGAL
jgi:GH35 family endo-1,4-beta-xylanase